MLSFCTIISILWKEVAYASQHDMIQIGVLKPREKPMKWFSSFMQWFYRFLLWSPVEFIVHILQIHYTKQKKRTYDFCCIPWFQKLWGLEMTRNDSIWDKNRYNLQNFYLRALDTILRSFGYILQKRSSKPIQNYFHFVSIISRSRVMSF